MSIDPDHLAFAERIRLDRSVPGPAFIASVEEAIDWIDLSLPAASRRWFRATREKLYGALDSRDPAVVALVRDDLVNALTTANLIYRQD